jgi:hypothetical protein
MRIYSENKPYTREDPGRCTLICPLNMCIRHYIMQGSPMYSTNSVIFRNSETKNAWMSQFNSQQTLNCVCVCVCVCGARVCVCVCVCDWVIHSHKPTTWTEKHAGRSCFGVHYTYAFSTSKSDWKSVPKKNDSWQEEDSAEEIIWKDRLMKILKPSMNMP